MMQPLPTRRVKQALARVRPLFMETRGLQRTTADAALMAGLDQQVCGVMLQNLIEAGFLGQRRGGVFVRKSDTPSIRR